MAMQNLFKLSMFFMVCFQVSALVGMEKTIDAEDRFVQTLQDCTDEQKVKDYLNQFEKTKAAPIFLDRSLSVLKKVFTDDSFYRSLAPLFAKLIQQKRFILQPTSLLEEKLKEKLRQVQDSDIQLCCFSFLCSNCWMHFYEKNFFHLISKMQDKDLKQALFEDVVNELVDPSSDIMPDYRDQKNIFLKELLDRNGHYGSYCNQLFEKNTKNGNTLLKTLLQRALILEEEIKEMYFGQNDCLEYLKNLINLGFNFGDIPKYKKLEKLSQAITSVDDLPDLLNRYENILCTEIQKKYPANKKKSPHESNALSDVVFTFPDNQ